jgi:glycine/D-amino acid oxidase-like deaminating enzyme
LEPHLAALDDSKNAPFWLDHEDRPDPLPSLEGEVRCQLLIVGGGFTGLWAALQAKERIPELDVVLIEGKEIGLGASGRNGGFISNSLAHGETNVKYHFPGEVERLAELGNQNLQEILDAFERYDIDAHFDETGSITVTTHPSQNEELEEWVEAGREVGEDLAWFDQAEIRREINSPTYCGGAWDRRGRNGLVNPALLCWGLKRAILGLGVRIYEGTPMVKLSPRADGTMVDCARGRIRCDRVLMATNAFRNSLSKVRRLVIPVWDYSLVTEPLNTPQLESVGWKRRQGLSNQANMFHYYRMTRDNRITWGGGPAVCYYYGSQIGDEVSDPRRRIEALSREFFETFPQLEGIRFTHRWGGIIGSTTRFCMTPGTAYDGRVAWSVGYTGLGVSATRFGARVALELLGYQASEILGLQLVRKPPLPWPPEPLRWMGVTMTRKELERADRNQGKRGLWLKLLDRVNLGFAC